MKESKIYGISSCERFAEKKPDQIVRAFFSEKVAKKFSTLMKYLAQKKRVYRIVKDEELEKLSKSMHHEGVCFIVQHVKPVSMKEWFSVKHKKDVLVFLEGISNPHNLGAIMRVCSHFGVNAILHPNPSLLQSGAAIRTSEGGFDSVELVECGSITDLLKYARNYQIFSTSSHQGKSVFDVIFGTHVILVFGEEGPGLTKEVISKTQCIQIPGSGAVESLNVATATAVLLAEVWRQQE